jgi:hypothetical protein
MGGEDNGLTLEGLAQKLQTQAQRLEALERENAELRHEVAALRGSQTRRDEVTKLRGSEARRDGEPAPGSPEEPEGQGRMSRRRLLSKAGAAAAGLVVAGALTQRDIREAKASSPLSHSIDMASRGAYEGTNEDSDGYGVWGNSKGYGLYGTSSADTGFAAGVLGVGRIGIHGLSDATGFFAVWGRHTGNGSGVFGDSADGYGGEFEGGKAQLKLVPKGTRGKPTTGTHTRGEIYMDSKGTLFVCTVSGTPGTWRRVQTATT